MLDSMMLVIDLRTSDRNLSNGVVTEVNKVLMLLVEEYVPLIVAPDVVPMNGGRSNIS